MPQEKATQSETADRERLERLDEAVLKQAAAEREQEMELARIDRDKTCEIQRIRARDAADARQRRGSWGAGVAIVIVLLGIIVAIWTYTDRAGTRATFRDVQIEQTRQQTIQACIRAGNIWVSDSCLITQRSPS